MDKITFVRLKNKLVQKITLVVLILVSGLVSSFSVVNFYSSSMANDLVSKEGQLSNSHIFDYQRGSLWNPLATVHEGEDCDGDGVTCEQEDIDGTDPNDPCSFILEHQNCAPSKAWKRADCDGDGVSNGKEKKDGTDPLDPCDFILEHQDCDISKAWKRADCDGDGVSNGKEKKDGTDPLDPCDFILEHQDCSPSKAWKNADCDGDGVSNGQEKEDGTDPLDPCDFILEHQDCTPTKAWKNADCDGDGVSNGQEKEDETDPLDPCDFILEHQDCTPSKAWENADCDGDGVSNGQEKEDETDPLDSCDFILEHQDCTPSEVWKSEDCDGDGVTNGDEKEDGTDPLDPCDYDPESITLPQSGDYLAADCDGDGVTNEQENEDGTDPQDPCDFVLDSQTVAPDSTWNSADCDGDGVTNGDEKEDGTDPLDPCDYNPESITLPQSGDYLAADCDGDGVTNEQENEDGTDPQDPCDFVLDSQTVAPDSTWNSADCDGDGVTNGDEKEDGTDPLDPCDYDPESITLPQSGDYLAADCDGDGVTNEQENEDGTDPQDPCDFVLDSQTVAPDSTWNSADCDGDGVTNGDEKEDGTDPLDPCDYNPESVTLPQSAAWETLDCDDDGNPNETDPDPLTANANDDFGSTQATTEVAINILENDDYLPNNASNNVGVTNLSRIGGNATGVITFDAETGFVNYIPEASESNSTVTIIYQVCNVLPDPSVCASATIYIEVGANVLDAVDDTYTSEITDEGIIPDSNVLDNDTYNGESLTLEDVILTSTPTDELSINEDGSVSVVQGTEPGIYSIDYTICDTADSGNCDTATVTVEVTQGTGNIIDAVDDTYTAEITNEGIIPDSNVLDNDTYNGETLTLADVTLTSTPTDELIINEDGSVSVVQGTEPGIYTIDYTICDVLNVDNCDTATVTVEVTQGTGNIIDAVDDTYTAEITDEGIIPDSNVLDNDTYNGESMTLEDVILTSTPTDELSINEDGSVSIVQGTEPGTYTIDYTVCDVLGLNNCDTATVTVEVMEEVEDNVIDAVDDVYNSGSAGGVITNNNVLNNDTLNDDLVSLNDVILTSTPTNELSILDDGSVRVAPGTPEGTYTIDYTICEAENPNNCDTATVTVVVENIEVNQMLTPNGDLKNDFLFIRGVEYIKSSTLKIFNRWGTQVFQGSNYDNVSNVFDGRVRGKSALSVNDYLPAGVYFYIFNYETEQGSFTDSEYIYISR
ncbi:gliding motility-associated C-terminal domain-containing protein [Allomuricauda sp. F6463D]|uniref:T9SS type B sorting domain-containing protein n=1 Tax=Allomuricauda sp. F6463D TaxID=2926409 RepID=UPI001FF4C0BA|nr:gliding motility-associated C-terminal domain-containing protein [Muricauda sp. F6463D]MCK0161958.1 gliding motility-associated C-terminal domain-containing protein [Muricauda sp. F6463D]